MFENIWQLKTGLCKQMTNSTNNVHIPRVQLQHVSWKNLEGINTYLFICCHKQLEEHAKIIKKHFANQTFLD